MIGHNNPPVDPLDAHDLAIRDLAELVSGMTAVETQEQADAVEAIAKQCRSQRQAADEARAAEKKPHDDAAKAVQAAWKPLLDRCDKAADAIKAAYADASMSWLSHQVSRALHDWANFLPESATT